ncbi:MAG: sugar-binding domain-containing protein [Mangrovibacterium sp.]
MNKILAGLLFIETLTVVTPAESQPGHRQLLEDDWLLKSSVLVPEDGSRISTVDYKPQEWFKTSVPTTVLNTLVKHGVYPDPRIGLNSFKIPDSSDEFNRKNDLEKYSYLPDKRNPWRDPYWYRKEFTIPAWSQGQHLWLEFKGINYRADVWLNGNLVADSQTMVGIYQRFRFDITDYVRSGVNCLAVKIYPVDHPGEPDVQLTPFGPARRHSGKEIQKDVTYTMAIGYDCMPPIPDRNMGIWQEVSIERTGQVDIRNPFIATDLPLPDTSRATLAVSAELVNANQSPVTGVLSGSVPGTELHFEQSVELAPNETKLVQVNPKLEMKQPRLWWPVNYGRQYLYKMKLEFKETQTSEGVVPKLSDNETVTFGIRKVTSKLHWFNGTPGLQIHVNGQKVFSQGGWLQPELLFDMPQKRMETEVRYLVGANLNTVSFEDLPVPNEKFLEACDRYGLMYWTSFYSSYWVMPDKDFPLDKQLLEKNAVDVIKRYRNHPGMLLYSCVGEGVPGKDVYLTWRKNILALDTTRLFVPTLDVRFMVEWLKDDVPTGLHDAIAFKWMDPAEYYEKVRAGGKWMFNTEVSVATYPPISSLKKFIPGLFKDFTGMPAPAPVDETWAHHDASVWMKDYDPAIRRLYGPPQNITDYIWKSHLVSATQHRAWSEAVNHRMWDITSGIWQWKLNACWPGVGWQVYDWYLKPLPNYYYYKTAFEPLHVQLNPLDGMVTVINRRLQSGKNLVVKAKVYDSQMKLKWEKQANIDIKANTYHDIFTVPPITGLTPVYFIKLILTQGGRLVSENFYWLSSKKADDFSELNKLQMVKLNVEQQVEDHGDSSLVHVRLTNSTDHIAFFIHLALTKGTQGDEVLPVFWKDNYFSLLPGESREVTATFAARDLNGAIPIVEVGGWNIRTDYHCDHLELSKTTVKSGETFTLAAGISNTFLDGSRVTLFVDGQPTERQWVWARKITSRETFTLNLREQGKHKLTVANRSITVEVE